MSDAVLPVPALVGPGARPQAGRRAAPVAAAAEAAPVAARHPTPQDVAGPLKPVDAAWLRMDEDDNLMMVTAVLWFGERVDRERLEAVLRERLLTRFPRFATRAVPARRGRARWEAVEVDLRHHLSEVVLPAPGDQAALERLCSVLMSTPLDAHRPAWQFHLVRDYAGGSAVIARLHHSLADGIALARVILALSDDGDDAADGPSRSRGGLGARLRAVAGAARLAVTTVATLGSIALLSPDPHSVFRGQLGTAKRAAWVEPLSVAEAKTLARAHGGTINDLVTAAVAGGLRRYALDRGRPPGDVRAFVPVDLRRGAPVPPDLGNRFGLLLLPLPVGAADPQVRVRRVVRTTTRLKAGPMAAATYTILGGLGVAPRLVQDLVVRFLATKGSAVMTNLPGPRQAVRIAGAPLTGVVPWVPQAARMAIGLSVFSYAGQVVLGVAGDEQVVPDPEALLEAIVAELDALRGLAAG